MFDFAARVLNPVYDGIMASFNKAAKVPDATERAEQLLTLRDTADAKLTKIIESENDKSLFSITAVGLGLLGVVTGIAGIVSVPVLPVLAGAALIIGGVSEGIRHYYQHEDAVTKRSAADDKIRDQLIQLGASNAVNLEKSPRFAKALKDSFKSAMQEQRLIEAQARDYAYMVGVCGIR